MTRPPHFFSGGPVITMQATGRYMGVGTAPGEPQLYMGEVLLSGELYARYSDGVSTLVPIDTLSPDPYSLTNKRLLITQEFSVVPSGRNEVTLEFTKPIYNEEAQELLLQKGPSLSGPEIGDTSFDPVGAGQYTVYAGGGSLGAPGGSSVIPLSPNFGARVVTVSNTVGFGVGQWVKMENPVGGEIAVNKISSIDGMNITFDGDIFLILEDGATIETINDSVAITEVTDYTIVLSTGVVTVNDTAATQNKLIWIKYKAELTDYDGGDFWIIPGILPVPDYSDPQDVSSHPMAVNVGSVTSSPTLFSFERDGGDLGKDYTLYAIAKDSEIPPNPSLARAIPFTHIPAIPVTVTLTPGPDQIEIRWNDTRTDGSTLTGYNVVRSNGQTFVPSTAKKLNLLPISPDNPEVVFLDAFGAANRDPAVPPPVSGNSYAYSIEAFIETGFYSILTRNLRIDQAEVLVAETQLSD